MKSVEYRNETYPKLTKNDSASDDVHRIIPLGLTLGEARAWYVNRVLIPRVRWALAALIIGSVILFSVSNWIAQLLEQTTHIIFQDSSFLAAGFLLTFGGRYVLAVTSHLSDSLYRTRNFLKRTCLGSSALSVLTFSSAALLIAYWYLPAHFIAAASNANAGMEMEAAFVCAGVLISLGATSLTRRVKLIALVVVGKALGLYGMFLIVTPNPVYQIYPIYEQYYAGAALLFLMLILDFTIMPLWLYNYFGKASGGHIALDNRTMA